MLFARPVVQTKLYPRTALVLLTALNLLNYIDRSVLNAVQPLIQSEFHVSDAQIGRLTTVFLIFYTLAAPFMGPLADPVFAKTNHLFGRFCMERRYAPNSGHTQL